LKAREGSFWSNRFYSTLIQDGEYLGRCLFYIDLNMVRAGAVTHPAEWPHTAWHEFVGGKKYKLIVNFPRLLKALEMPDMEHFRTWYQHNLEIRLAGLAHQRELYWSRARAVGDETWLTDMVGKKRQANIHRNSDNEPFYLNYGKIK